MGQCPRPGRGQKSFFGAIASGCTHQSQVDPRYPGAYGKRGMDLAGTMARGLTRRRRSVGGLDGRTVRESAATPGEVAANTQQASRLSRTFKRCRSSEASQLQED